MSDFDEWIEARDKALRELDVEVMIATGCSRQAALPALHRVRYETTTMPDELRHESRAWLEANGYSRMKGLPWPPAGELER